MGRQYGATIRQGVKVCTDAKTFSRAAFLFAQEWTGTYTTSYGWSVLVRRHTGRFSSGRLNAPTTGSLSPQMCPAPMHTARPCLRSALQAYLLCQPPRQLRRDEKNTGRVNAIIIHGQQQTSPRPPLQQYLVGPDDVPALQLLLVGGTFTSKQMGVSNFDCAKKSGPPSKSLY